MSGPDGQITKRDQRREARRQELRQQQTQRQRQRTQQIRARRVRTGGLAVAVVLAVVIIGLLVATFAFGAFGGGPQPLRQAARGQVIDGLACAKPPSNARYLNAYVKLYTNGRQATVPAGIGIVSDKGCRYPLYVPSGAPNAVAALAGNHSYVLGNLFDLWGQPLSSGQVLGNKADASHKLAFEVSDAQGNLSPYTGDPRGIGISDHQTIVILYNSPSVKPTPYTNWSGIHD
ncbi:MAG: hypothetical protein IVW57_05885 [Ktedonobacterales bacterium]|nr:hypothetical protein [Ktedonobacterales bacterium]